MIPVYYDSGILFYCSNHYRMIHALLEEFKFLWEQQEKNLIQTGSRQGFLERVNPETQQGFSAKQEMENELQEKGAVGLKV